MAKFVDPKWDIATAIDKGRKVYELALKYDAELKRRLKPGEVELLGDELAELELRRSGQAEKLIDQKAKTKSQDEAALVLKDLIIDLRQMVKNAGAGADVKKAFGIGEPILFKKVDSVRSAANVFISAFDTYKQWAVDEAAILDDDIVEIKTLLAGLSNADSLQEKAKVNRKMKTMDKNVLQRKIEDQVGRICAFGIREFRRSKPEVARLFEQI